MLRSYRALPATVLGLSLVLTGCSVADDSAASRPAQTSAAGTSTSPDPTASPTSTSTSTAPAPTDEPTDEPTVPVMPKATKGPAAAKAFAGQVIEAWGFALRTNDASVLREASAKGQPCEGCRALEAELKKRRQAGWFVDFQGLNVSATKLVTTENETVATAAVSIPESDSYRTDGSFRNTSPAHPKGTFEVRMRPTENGFVLLSFTVR